MKVTGKTVVLNEILRAIAFGNCRTLQYAIRNTQYAIIHQLRITVSST